MAEEMKVGCARPTGGPVGERFICGKKPNNDKGGQENGYSGTKGPGFYASAITAENSSMSSFRISGEMGGSLFLSRGFHLCLSH
jgi:hypothetical protein